MRYALLITAIGLALAGAYVALGVGAACALIV